MFSFLKKKKLKKTVETQVENLLNKENEPQTSSPLPIICDSKCSSPQHPCDLSSQQSSIHSHLAGPDLHRLLTSGYLNNEKNLGYLKRANANQIASSTRSSQFHRPIGFSYNNRTSTLFSNQQKKGMKALVTGQTKLRKVHCSQSSTLTRPHPSSTSIDNDPLVLSRYSGGFIPDPDAPKKIESLDWPAPIALQAVPELLRKVLHHSVESLTEDDEADDDDDDQQQIHEQKLDPISKLKDTSGMAHDLLEHRPTRLVPLDPWKASRSPSAAVEPSRHCRFRSPKIASPSQRIYTHSSSTSNANESLSNIFMINHSKRISLPQTSQQTLRHPDVMDMERSCDLASTTHSYDMIETEPIKSIKTADVDVHYERTEPSTRSAPVLMGQLKIYPYEQIKISTNKRLPTDVRRDHLEYHLSDDDFQHLFQMKRSDFYRLPEWRRIDLKKRLKLF